MELSAAEHARVGGDPSAPSMSVGTLSVRAVALLRGVLVECRFVRRECSGSLRGFTPRGNCEVGRAHRIPQKSMDKDPHATCEEQSFASPRNRGTLRRQRP